MGFMDSYKHLEKLCGEVMGDDRRVSAYIDEMLRLSRGASLVRGWNDDLKNLKHYRWVRNQIVHEPDCTEETMCDPGDAQWLDDFYDRIMDQTDPLALYRKATRTRTTPELTRPAPQVYTAPTQTHDRHTRLHRRPGGCALFLLGGIAVVAVLLL